MNYHKELLQVSFLCIPEQLLSQIIFGQLNCYEVTLVKKYNKPLLQKSETKFFKQKIFHKKLVQSQREKKTVVLRLNQMMPRLLTRSECLQSNCQ